MTDKKDLYYPNGQPLLIYDGDVRKHFTHNKVLVYKPNGDPHIPDLDVFDNDRLVQQRKRDTKNTNHFIVQNYIEDKDGLRVETHTFDVTRKNAAYKGKPAIQLDYSTQTKHIRSFHDIKTGERFYERTFTPENKIHSIAHYINNVQHGVGEKFQNDRLVEKYQYDAGILLEIESYKHSSRSSFIHKPDQITPDKIREEHAYGIMSAVKILRKHNRDYCRTSYKITTKEDCTETSPVIGSKSNKLGHMIYLRHCEQSYSVHDRQSFLKIGRDGNEVSFMVERSHGINGLSIMKDKNQPGYGTMSFYDSQKIITHSTPCRVKTIEDKDFDRLLVGYSRLTDKPKMTP